LVPFILCYFIFWHVASGEVGNIVSHGMRFCELKLNEPPMPERVNKNPIFIVPKKSVEFEVEIDNQSEDRQIKRITTKAVPNRRCELCFASRG
jgi:hypothetical protein